MDLPSLIQWKRTVDNLMTQDKKSIQEFLRKFEWKTSVYNIFLDWDIANLKHGAACYCLPM